MKTIAISIDEGTLQGLDRLTRFGDERRRRAGAKGPRISRSEIVRRALQEFLARHAAARRNERERVIFAKHRRRIAGQAEVLVAEQAEL